MSWFERKLKKLFQGDVAIDGDITANDGTFSGTVKADTISEYTADNGVVIDGVTIKDNDVSATDMTATGTVQGEQLTSTDDIDVGDNIYMNSDEWEMRSNTVNASDNYDGYICGGGASHSDRGAYIGLSGNEATNDGRLLLVCGNDSGANKGIRITTAGSQPIELETSNTDRFVIDGNGAVTGSIFGAWSTESVTLTPAGTTWTTTPTLQSCRYKKIGKMVWYQIAWSGGKPAATASYVQWTRPAGYTIYITDYSTKNMGSGDIWNGTWTFAAGVLSVSSTVIRIYIDGANFSSSLTYNIRVSGTYETSD